MQFETYDVAYEGRNRYGKYLTSPSEKSTGSSVAGEGGSTGGGGLVALETFSGDSAGTWTIPDNYFVPSEGSILKVRVSTPCFSGTSSADTIINTIQLGDGDPYLVWFAYDTPLTDQINRYDEIDLTYRESAGTFTLSADTEVLSAGTYTNGWVMESAHNGIWRLSGNTAYTNFSAVGMKEVSAWGSGSSASGLSVIDNLTSDSAVDALSAHMGKVLDELKQDLLVAGENIKTINGVSILGSGNINIGGGSGSTSGATYYPGDNISISTGNVISVTGITSYTGITSQEVTGALGYTPYNSSNPAGYITSAALPTKVSDLQNDAGYITNADIPEQYWEETGNTTIKTDYNAYSEGELSCYGQGSTAQTISVIDNLNSTATTDALSANQGRVLKEYIDTHSGKTYTAGSHINISQNNVISVSEDLPYLPLSGGTETGFVWFNEGLQSHKDISFDKNYKIKAMSGSAEINVIAFDGDFVFGSLDESFDPYTKTTDFISGTTHPVFIDGSHFYIRTCWVWDENLNRYQKVISLDINQYGDATLHRNFVAGGEISCFGAGTGNTLIQDLYDEIQALKQRVTDLENAGQ